MRRNFKHSESGALFHLKAKVLGDKKVQQHAVAMKDHEINELLLDAEQIKVTSLNCINKLLDNREPQQN